MRQQTITAGALLLAAVLASARSARADEPKSVEITVDPRGRPWSIGSYGTGAECHPTCTLHLAPERYQVTMGDTQEDVWIQGPSEIAYRPSIPVLRYAGGGMVIGGAVVGGVMTYLAAELCVSQTTTGPDGTTTSTSSSCGTPVLSRSSQYALIGVASASFASMVVGGILFYLGGESIRVKQHDVPEPPSRRSFDVMMNMTREGASFGVSARF